MKSSCATLLVLLSLLLLSCDGSDSPTEPSNPAPAGPVTGSWFGTSGQGHDISFTVSENSNALVISEFVVTVTFDHQILPQNGGFCPAILLFEATFGAGPLLTVPITDNAFLIRVPDDIPLPLTEADVRFEGTFDTTNSASGLLRADVPDAFSNDCISRGETTWTATPI
jgi:hypothetical protein